MNHTHSLTQSLTHSLGHSLIQSLIHSVTHSVSHSFSHSLSHSGMLSLTYCHTRFFHYLSCTLKGICWFPVRTTELLVANSNTWHAKTAYYIRVGGLSTLCPLNYVNSTLWSVSTLCLLTGILTLYHPPLLLMVSPLSMS